MDNPGFASLVDTLRYIQEPMSASPMDIRDLMILFGAKATPEGYFSYFGSLTIPNYNQVVTWILYPSIIVISNYQVRLDQVLSTHNCLLNRVSLLYDLAGGSACRRGPCDLHCISPLISL